MYKCYIQKALTRQLLYASGAECDLPEQGQEDAILVGNLTKQVQVKASQCLPGAVEACHCVHGTPSCACGNLTWEVALQGKRHQLPGLAPLVQRHTAAGSRREFSSISIQVKSPCFPSWNPSTQRRFAVRTWNTEEGTEDHLENFQQAPSLEAAKIDRHEMGSMGSSWGVEKHGLWSTRRSTKENRSDTGCVDLGFNTHDLCKGEKIVSNAMFLSHKWLRKPISYHLGIPWK